MNQIDIPGAWTTPFRVSVKNADLPPQSLPIGGQKFNPHQFLDLKAALRKKLRMTAQALMFDEAMPLDRANGLVLVFNTPKGMYGLTSAFHLFDHDLSNLFSSVYQVEECLLRLTF